MSKTLSDFKALLFDVDNTLTNTERVVTPRTVTALKAVSEQGYQVAICSAKYYASLHKAIFPIFPENALHILCGGAQLMRGNGEVVWEQSIPGAVVQEICAKGDEFNQGYLLPIGHSAFASQRMIEEYTGAHPLAPTMKPMNEITDWATPIIAVRHISDEFMAYLQSRSDVQLKDVVSYGGLRSMDITAHGVNKAAGIEEWCTLQNISPNEIIGFGDSENDLEYLQLVGHAVAMGNSTEAIKKNADTIIGHTNDDGLAIYLENLLKGNPV